MNYHGGDEHLKSVLAGMFEENSRNQNLQKSSEDEAPASPTAAPPAVVEGQARSIRDANASTLSDIVVKPKREAAELYARLVFDGLQGHVALRAVEEPKPAGRKSRTIESWPRIDENLPKTVGNYVEWCAENGFAAFLIPAIVREGGGSEEDLQSARFLVADFDKGDIGGNIAKMAAELGAPTFVVESGGVSELTNHPKVHVYYRLSHEIGPSEFEVLNRARVRLAQKYGADTSVATHPAQPLRVAGSVHLKTGRKLVKFAEPRSGAVYALSDIAAKLGAEDTPANASAGFDMDFSRDRPASNIERVLTQPILAEGKSSDGLTRFDGGSTAIGHYLRLRRDPATRWTDEEAWQAAKDWNAAQNVPPWSEDVLRQHFDRLRRIDDETHGPIVPAAPVLPPHEWAKFDQWQGDSYRDTPPKRHYLIEGVLPLGVPGVVCASGGLGKSYLMLDLALRVATGRGQAEGLDFSNQLIFGGEVKEFGTAVVFVAEDDKGTVHERFAELDPLQKRITAKERLRVIPLPDAGGPRALFAEKYGVYSTTAEYEAVRNWLKTLPDLKLVVFDPLQTFVAADITSKPEAGQFVMSALGALAAELGATVLVTHHLKKTDRKISNPDDARAAIRGTTALVDGVRWAYALWETEGAAANDVPAAAGAVVKANGATDRHVHKYQRLPCGVLRQLPPSFSPGGRADLLAALETAIIAAARAGAPFTMTGPNGLFDQRHRLPASFHAVTKQGFVNFGQELLNAGRIVKGTARGSKGRNWLDEPSGEFAMGNGCITSGSGLPSVPVPVVPSGNELAETA